MVNGYTSATSVRQGDNISLYLSSTEPGIKRLQIEQVSRSPVIEFFDVYVETQAIPSHNPWEGYHWTTTYRFHVPIDYPSGLYVLKEGGNVIHTFVVKPRTLGANSRIVVFMPCLTRQAYNPNPGTIGGGKSLYDFNSVGGRASRVSFGRVGGNIPHDSVEASLIRWLENETIAVDYFSNIDLHSSPQLLDNYDCLVLVGHDEYWTKQMVDNTERFLLNGGNIICLSGNTCYRAIRLEDANRTIIFHKYAGDDPETDTLSTSVAWAEPPLNRPQNRILGAGFTEGAFNGSPARYRIHFPEHWLFNGIDEGETRAFMTYETDAAQYVLAAEGYPHVTGAEDTPLNFTVLADADLSTWLKPGRATMGIMSKHGKVFHSGTTDWIQGLNDAVIATVTRNVFARFRQRLERDWELIGHANNGIDLAATSGQLFIATEDNNLWRRFPVQAEVNWRRIGHANHVVAMTGFADMLFCITQDNRLWQRQALPLNIPWTLIGSGPENGSKALAAAGGQLYVIDDNGTLLRRPLEISAMAIPPGEWVRLESFNEENSNIVTMTSYSDILFAATSDNRLLRTNQDFIAESTEWLDIHHCNHARGLAVIEWMLYVATGEYLWQMDIHGLRQP